MSFPASFYAKVAGLCFLVSDRMLSYTLKLTQICNDHYDWDIYFMLCRLGQAWRAL